MGGMFFSRRVYFLVEDTLLETRYFFSGTCYGCIKGSISPLYRLFYCNRVKDIVWVRCHLFLGIPAKGGVEFISVSHHHQTGDLIDE